MKSKISWAEYRYDAVTGDLTANVCVSWTPNGGFVKGTGPVRVDYPRRQVDILSAYAVVTDGTGPNLRDGTMVTIGELGPRPTSIVEWRNTIQTPEDRCYVFCAGGNPVDLGMVFYVAAGGFIAAGDRLYCLIKYREWET